MMEKEQQRGIKHPAEKAKPTPPAPQKEATPPEGITIEGVKLYTFEETAALMHMSKRSVQSYYLAGKLEGRKMGRRIYILAESIAAYLKTGATNF